MNLALRIGRSYGIVVVTVALFALLALTTDRFLTSRNMRNVLDQQSSLLVAAALITITMIAGGFDLSVAAVAVVAPLFALRVENATDVAVLGLVVGCLVGTGFGAANGLLITTLRVNSFITTLATSFMIFGIGYLISDRSILRPDTEAFGEIARSRWLGLTSATWIAVAVVAAAWVLLSGTRFGRHVFASGGNAEAARPAGVPLMRVRIATFTLSGAAAGLAGVMTSSRTQSAQPSDDTRVRPQCDLGDRRRRHVDRRWRGGGVAHCRRCVPHRLHDQRLQPPPDRPHLAAADPPDGDPRPRVARRLAAMPAAYAREPRRRP